MPVTSHSAKFCVKPFRRAGLSKFFAGRETTSMPGTLTDLHTHLREWRLHLGLTLEQVANSIGSKANTLSGWELGNRRVDLDDLRKLADLYGVHPAALLFAPPSDPRFEHLRRADAVIARADEGALRKWLDMGDDLKQAERPSAGATTKIFARREK